MIARPFQPAADRARVQPREPVETPGAAHANRCAGEKFRLKDYVVGVGSAKFSCQIEYVGLNPAST